MPLADGTWELGVGLEGLGVADLVGLLGFDLTCRELGFVCLSIVFFDRRYARIGCLISPKPPGKKVLRLAATGSWPVRQLVGWSIHQYFWAVAPKG